MLNGKEHEIISRKTTKMSTVVISKFLLYIQVQEIWIETVPQKI